MSQPPSIINLSAYRSARAPIEAAPAPHNNPLLPQTYVDICLRYYNDGEQQLANLRLLRHLAESLYALERQCRLTQQAWADRINWFNRNSCPANVQPEVRRLGATPLPARPRPAYRLP